MSETRMGKFNIPVSWIIDDRAKAVRALKDVIIYAAETWHSVGVIHYTGSHPDFMPVELGDKIPYYSVKITKFDDGSIAFVEWQRT